MPDEPDLTIGKAQSAALAYKNTPKLRALVEGVGGWLPGVTAANTYIVERLSQLERERTEALFRYLDEAGAVLTPELIESDDFLHCFAITTRAAQRTRRMEMIRLFAHLLSAAAKGYDITDVDEYEELLGILEDMSVREMAILTILARHSPVENEDVWASFIADVERLPGIRPDEVSAMLARLNRTGLYSSMNGTYANMEGRGDLTPRYYRLRDLIADTDGNVIKPEPSADRVAPSTSPGPH